MSRSDSLDTITSSVPVAGTQLPLMPEPGKVPVGRTVGRKEVPAKLRQLLNVESGINDGLALPVVLLLIAAAGPTSGRAELP